LPKTTKAARKAPTRPQRRRSSFSSFRILAAVSRRTGACADQAGLTLHAPVYLLRLPDSIPRQRSARQACGGSGRVSKIPIHFNVKERRHPEAYPLPIHLNPLPLFDVEVNYIWRPCRRGPTARLRGFEREFPFPVQSRW
jgi:hypothetical protein